MVRAFWRRAEQRDLELLHHVGRDLVLDLENVVQLAVVGLRPQVRVGAGLDQLRGDPDRVAGLADRAFQHVGHVQRARDLRDRDLFAFKQNDEVRAVTCNCGIFASRFSSSSEIPSEKYSFALSSLMLTNGSTAMLFSGMAVSDVAGLRETIMKAATIAPSTSSPIATVAQRTRARCFLTASSFLGNFGLPTSSE